MESIGSEGKIARATAKLDSALQSGDYYAALQLYRTLVKRKIDSGAFDEARTMLVEGARTLLRRGKALEGLDLGDMMLKSLYSAHALALTASTVQAVCDIATEVPSGSDAARVAFLKSAVRWSKDAPLDASAACSENETGASAVAPAKDTSVAAAASGGGQQLRTGDSLSSQQRRHVALVSELHLAAARACVTAGPEYFADAQRYYLEAHNPEAFAAFLLQWAAKGYAGYLGDANGVYERFVAASTAAVDTPLAHFLKFLLATLERDARPLFEMLCDKYKPALSRDASFGSLMSAIALRFYNIQPPRSGMAAMMQNMQNMMGMLGGGAARPAVKR